MYAVFIKGFSTVYCWVILKLVAHAVTRFKNGDNLNNVHNSFRNLFHTMKKSMKYVCKRFV